jgi:hypothetical protein
MKKKSLFVPTSLAQKNLFDKLYSYTFLDRFATYPWKKQLLCVLTSGMQCTKGPIFRAAINICSALPENPLHDVELHIFYVMTTTTTCSCTHRSSWVIIKGGPPPFRWKKRGPLHPFAQSLIRNKKSWKKIEKNCVKTHNASKTALN